MPPNVQKPFAGLTKINLEGLRFRLIDAENQVVGRLSAQIAMILQGKDKPTFSNHRDGGDVCVVVNASKAVLTGKKWDQKTYRRHSGYQGGLKETIAKDLWAKDPTAVLRKAVRGMLPKNRLIDKRMLKLRLFPDADHAYKEFDLVRFEMPPRQLRDKNLGWLMPAGFEPMNPEAFALRLRASKLRHQAGDPSQLPQVEFDDLLAPEEQQFVEASTKQA